MCAVHLCYFIESMAGHHDMVICSSCSWIYRYDNWVAAMVDWREIEHSQEWHDWVQKAFEAFDVDGSGSIGIQDLQDMLCQGEICAVSCLLCCRPVFFPLCCCVVCSTKTETCLLKCQSVHVDSQ